MQHRCPHGWVYPEGNCEPCATRKELDETEHKLRTAEKRILALEAMLGIDRDINTLPPIPFCGVGALTAGEEAILRAWAYDYARAAIAAAK